MRENGCGLEKILKDITMDDMQEPYRQYAELIGLENLLLLARYYGGSSFYVPKLEEVIKAYKYKRIQQEFNGYNRKKLAVKYQVSESTAYRILKENGQKDKEEPFEGQVRLF